MSSTAPYAPAGWYRDPLGLPQLRWWNGIMWTNQIEDHRFDAVSSDSYNAELVATA